MSDEHANQAGPDVADPTLPALITTQIAEFNDMLAGLNEMMKLRGMAYDLTTTAGSTQARRDRKKLITTRNRLEDRRLDLNKQDRASIAERIALRDSEADRLTALIRELELPIDQQIRADEERREELRLAKVRAAEARAAGFRERIEAITNVGMRAVGKGSDEIQSKIDLVTRIAIDSTFEEFEAAAGTAKLETLLRLQELHAAALLSEAAAAEAQATRERLAQLEKENTDRLAREWADRQAREAEEVKQREIRNAQSVIANGLVDEIRLIQRRAFTSSSLGLLQMAEFVEQIVIGDELGDFAGIAQKAKDDALSDLHEMHTQVLQRESDKRDADREQRRIQEEQAAAQQRLDEAASALARQAAELAEQQRVIANADQAEVVDAEFFDPGVDQSPVFELAIIPVLPEGDALALAEFFHATYERLAPEFGYETRPETKAFDKTSAQGQLMVAVCAEVLKAHFVTPVCEVD